jgi:anaerobic magnesium-protoporphyrin IX monomethyl ester cyclase
MARVLLINPSYVPSYSGTKASIVNPVFPTLGLATIAAAAMQRGHTVEILDLCYTPYNYEDVKERILAFKPDVVGITATTPLMNQLRDISVLVKDISASIKVVGGGPHPSAMPKESLLESRLDAVFVGEADISFAEYCDGIPAKDIKGLFYRDGDEIFSTGLQPVIANLDDLPMPAWELYDKEIYRKYGSRLYTRYPPMSGIEFSRGCVYKCDFCASKMTMALGYRKKSPARCAAELKKLQELGFREAMVVDDIFTSDQEWATSVCDAIIDSGVKIAWTCSNGVRVESVEENLFRKMRKAGCYRVSFGFESGNDEILKGFGKGGRATIEQGKRGARLARQSGIDTNGFFMLGLTADTEKTMMDTIEYARELPLDMMKFGRTIAFPGTDMFNRYHAQNIINSYNWDDYFMYSNKTLFTHEHLSLETIEEYTDIAYKKALLYNPGFIIRRLLHGIKTGEFFWDIYYALKFYFMPSLSTPIPSRYYAEDRWPQYDFRGKKPSRDTYQVVRKSKGDMVEALPIRQVS